MDHHQRLERMKQQMVIPITTNAKARQSGIQDERKRILNMIENRMTQCTQAQEESTQKESKLAFAAMWIELNDLKWSVEKPIIEP